MGDFNTRYGFLLIIAGICLAVFVLLGLLLR